MANMVIGRIVQIAPTETITTTKGEFSKRQLTLDTTRFDPYTGERDKYENFPSFEFTGDGCALLDGYKAGDVVQVSFELNGNKYIDQTTGATRYFTRVRGYKVELKKREEAQAVEAVQSVVPPVEAETKHPNGDLPF